MSDRNIPESTRGFTLVETVTALSIAAVIAMFFAGFLHPQLKLYYDFDHISQAESMCSEAYRKMEEKLRYSYIFCCDDRNTGELAYYIRAGQGPPDSMDEEDLCYEELPPLERWPRISAEELDVRAMNGMVLELDFSGTENTQAHVRIKVKRDGDVMYEQEAFISSMYSYTIDKEEWV